MSSVGAPLLYLYSFTVLFACSAVKHTALSSCEGVTTYQSVGIWLAPLMTDNSAGQVNVPEAATSCSQFNVAVDGLQAVKLTSIDES